MEKMMSMFKKTGSQKETKSDFKIEDDDGEEESVFMNSLKVNLSRLIAYAESADTQLQREVVEKTFSPCVLIVHNQVAEKLANEAVKPARQVQIVEYGGLKLLVPLTKSTDVEVQRLAAHALANLSVNGWLSNCLVFNTHHFCPRSGKSKTYGFGRCHRAARLLVIE